MLDKYRVSFNNFNKLILTNYHYYCCTCYWVNNYCKKRL